MSQKELMTKFADWISDSYLVQLENLTDQDLQFIKQVEQRAIRYLVGVLGLDKKKLTVMAWKLVNEKYKKRGSSFT